MSNTVIESIKLSDIDMDKCYYNPGCGLAIDKPYATQRVMEIIDKHFGKVKLHDICCRHDPKLEKGSTIINACGGCDRRFRSMYEGIQTISLWEILDSIDDFSFPDYKGIEMSVQDPCPFRQKPQVHKAVRSLLAKMNIRVVEAEFNGEVSICCGDSLWPKLSVEEVVKKQKERAAQMPCQEIAVYCTACIQSMATGGKTPRHLIDLILEEETIPADLPIDEYHQRSAKYIEEH